MPLPEVLFIGPMKSGTTWIHDYLSDRGDIALPSQVKETFFFDRHYERGIKWYAKQYSPGLSIYSSVVEVAPSLLPHPEAPWRVANLLPGVKLVVTMRDPVARSWSHYLHMRRYGYTDSCLRLAVEQYPQIVLASRYQEHIDRWRKANPASELHVLNFDELRESPESYARSLCDILGVDFREPSDRRLSASNEAAVAPSYHLARVGRALSYRLRDAGFYGTVEFAKHLGLKKLFFGGSTGSKLDASPTDLEFLTTSIKGHHE